MLAPSEREILRDLLRPPPGAELDTAIGTTFTLDLRSALVVPLAFAAYRTDDTADPVAMLEAVRSVADRVTIFCQAGHIKVPAKASDLMAFLEPIVAEVEPPNAGYLFHPKLWVLKYRYPSDAVSYRLVCATRNLTDDTAWDAVVRLDGTAAEPSADLGTIRALNSPLTEFVKALPAMAVHTLTQSRRRSIERLTEDLETVDWEYPNGMNRLAFHAMGVGVADAATRFHRATRRRWSVVVSPFLDDETVAGFRSYPHRERLAVVSRAESLEQLDPSTVEGLDCYTIDTQLAAPDDVSPVGEDGAQRFDGADVDTPEPSPGSLLGGLHAKVYGASHGQSGWLVIGSPNATTAGFGDHNVEFAVELGAPTSVLGYDQLMGPDSLHPLLTPYEPTGGAEPDPLEEARRDLDRTLRNLARRPFSADVVADGDGWIETITTESATAVPDHVEISVGLLTTPGNRIVQTGTSIRGTFHLRSVADVTPFVVVGARMAVDGEPLVGSTVVRAALTGDPPGRFDELIARQVDTPEKFIQFVLLLLALADDGAAPPMELVSEGGDGFFGDASARGLFESLVRAVGNHPSFVADLDRLVTRLERTDDGRARMPEGFTELWATVKRAARSLGES